MAAELNIARLNGPFQEHSLGNLLNARSKAEARISNSRLAATHRANRSLRHAINRHIGLRRNESRRVEAAARERRLARLATRLFAAEATAEAAAPTALPPVRVPPSGIAPYYTSQFIERGTVPKQRRTRRATLRRRS